MKKYLAVLLFFIVLIGISWSPAAPLQVALLKYKGGGDWYANPTALPNLIKFCNTHLRTNIDPDFATVEAGSKDIFNYPFVHMTGHGNVVFDDQEAANLRNYMLAGGFLHIDDNYGMDPYIRPQMKKVFPELEFVELPFSHPVFNQKFPFPGGLPKVHEHDGKPPQGFGLMWEGRLVCLYTFETDLGDGWEDAAVHNDSEENRLKALRMGANIIQFVFSK
ncbi:MAG: hypothetical protein FD170_1441 [Bacteroidetes bacterium]|nr:MAG: hypothetical protein FD170_1441 [Bacteroidota bacterium]